jgi:hypothetical protein
MLLKEYELCQEDTQALETTIWQTCGAIGLAATGALTLLVTSDKDWRVFATVGFLVVGMTLIWWGMARRWWSIQHIKFMRMRHIEAELGLYQYRYVAYADSPGSLSESGLSLQQLEDIAGYKHYQRTGVQAVLAWLPWLVAAAWVASTVLRALDC